MGKFKRIVAVCLVAVLGMVTFTGCGGEKEVETTAPERATLNSSVTIAAAKGDGLSTIGELNGKVKVKSLENQNEVMNQLLADSCDFAVLTPVEAARYFNEYGGIKAVTTLSLADWNIAMKGYDGNVEDEKDLVKLGGQIMLGIKDEAEFELADEEATEPVTEGTIDPVTGEPIESTDGVEAEPTEPEVKTANILPREMGEEIFQTLMAKEGYGFYDGQINWIPKEESTEYANASSIILASSHNMKTTLEHADGFTSVYSLGDLWEKEFENPIPGYILVATDKFLDKRGAEVTGLLDVIEEQLEANKSKSELNLVAYNYSNRGVALIRDFMDNLIKYNSDGIDGNTVSKDFYWYGK